MSLKEPRYRTVAELHELLITQDEQLSAALAAHEETKRKLEVLAEICAEGGCEDWIDLKEKLAKLKEYERRCEAGYNKIDYLDAVEELMQLRAKLKELQEQKPYGWFDTECNQMFFDRHERKPETEIPLYAYPIDVDALLQQARREENEACAELCESNRLNDMTGKDCAAAIRARMK